MVSHHVSHIFLQTFQSHVPATSISHSNEPVATNTMFSDEPALGSNATPVQIFILHNSEYVNDYGGTTDHDVSHTLEQNIMNQGAMDVLTSNNLKSNQSESHGYSTYVPYQTLY